MKERIEITIRQDDEGISYLISYADGGHIVHDYGGTDAATVERIIAMLEAGKTKVTS